MAKRPERFSDWKDATQAHRNVIVYTIMALSLVAAMMGWGLLPDMVSLTPDLATPYFHPKGQLLLLDLGISTLFSALFWRRPRELAYLFCACVGLLMTFVLLYANLGV